MISLNKAAGVSITAVNEARLNAVLSDEKLKALLTGALDLPHVARLGRAEYLERMAAHNGAAYLDVAEILRNASAEDIAQIKTYLANEKPSDDEQDEQAHPAHKYAKPEQATKYTGGHGFKVKVDPVQHRPGTRYNADGSLEEAK